MDKRATGPAVWRGCLVNDGPAPKWLVEHETRGNHPGDQYGVGEQANRPL